MLGTSERKGHQGTRLPSSQQQQYSSGSRRPSVPEGQQQRSPKKQQRTGSVYNEHSPSNTMNGENKGGGNRDNKSIGEVGKWMNFF